MLLPSFCTQKLLFLVSSCRLLFQEIESLTQELAVVEGQIVETNSQVKPFEAAKQAANKAHQVRKSQNR